MRNSSEKKKNIIIVLGPDVIKYICQFIGPLHYRGVNRYFREIALTKMNEKAFVVQRWYKKYSLPRAPEILTPKYIVHKFRSFDLSRHIRHRKCLPEYIACTLNMNLYTLRTLTNKSEKKKRNIMEILDWIRAQNFSQYALQTICY